MIKINCKNCKKHCCGEIKQLRPILLPFEEKIFKKDSNLVKGLEKDMFVLKRKRDGNCIYLENRICKIYEERPVECRLYPFLLDFKNGINIKLDERYCKLLKNLKYNIIEINAYLSTLEISKDWINSYKIMDEY